MFSHLKKNDSEHGFEFYNKICLGVASVWNQKRISMNIFKLQSTIEVLSNSSNAYI